MSTKSASRHTSLSWARKAKARPSLTGSLTPATRICRSATVAVASSVGLARENARPLDRLNVDASVFAPAGVRRTFVRIVSPSQRTRSRVSLTGAVANTSDTR
nr:hypothetical protein [Haloarcula sp. CBA1115]